MDQLYAGKFDVVSKILVSGSKIASGGGERKPHWYKTRTVATRAIGDAMVNIACMYGLGFSQNPMENLDVMESACA